MTERDHYDELRNEVYLPLIDEHQEAKAQYRETKDNFWKARRDALIESISMVEDVLNTWEADRDGEAEDGEG